MPGRRRRRLHLGVPVDPIRDQFAQIATLVREAKVYLGNLRDHMEARGFDPNDLLYRQTARSVAALHGLHMALVYAGCGMKSTFRTEVRYNMATGSSWAARVAVIRPFAT